MPATRIGFRVFLVAAAFVLARGSARAICANITTDTPWSGTVLVDCDIYVGGTPKPTLTIAAGTIVKFNAGARLIVGWSGSPGELVVNGTSSSPVTFTSNGTLSPGYWHGILFGSGSTSASTITWATIQWGGNVSSGSVHIEGASAAPTFSHVTITDGTYAAISVKTGAATVNGSSTIKNHPMGVWIDNGGTASLQSSSIINNTGFPISIHPAVTLGTVSALTMTGNGTNGIELRGAGGVQIDHSATWKNLGWTYYLTGWYASVTGTSPVLTIQAGVTVKFAAGTSLGVGGGGQLQAVGTSASRIDFTANGSTTPGFWNGIQFNQAAAGSNLAYVNIRYAGGSGVGLGLVRSTATISHVLFDSNSNAAVYTFGVQAVVQMCAFVNNTGYAINNGDPANVVKASLDWWGVATGPNTTGGQTVTSGVTFEPWLTATESAPQFIATATQTDRTFNPNIGVYTKVTFTTAQSANWTVTFSGFTPTKVFTGTGSSATVTWDGKKGDGVQLGTGTYAYQIDTVGGTSAKGVAIIDTTKALTLTNPVAAPTIFSPNADGTQDTTTVTATINFDAPTWTVNVKTGNTVVRTGTGTGPALSYTWDGKNTGGTGQGDGVYTLEVVANDGTAQVTKTTTVTLDNALPTATFTAPTPNQTLSNIYTNGSVTVAITGSATDTNFSLWTLDYGVGPTPTSWTGIWSSNTPVSNGTFSTLDTSTFANGVYTFRLQVWDLAGNYKKTTVTATIGNFKATQSTYSINPSASQTVTYTSTVPFTVTETLTIKDAAGAVVKTLVNAVQRPAGSYPDPWDGKNAGVPLKDGPYSYFITVTAGASSMNWDRTGVRKSDYVCPCIPTVSGAFDPFRNVPLTLTYNLGEATKTTFQMSKGQDYGNYPTQCTVPSAICVAQNEYTPPGTYTYVWPGTSSSGVSVFDKTGTYLWIDDATFWQNVVVVFGSKPTIASTVFAPTSFKASPPNQTLDFDITVFTGQTATVTVSYLSQASVSVLHTVTLTNQTSGHKQVSWDGKADNGVIVEAGRYTAIIKVQDSIGNIVTRHAVTSVSY